VETLRWSRPYLVLVLLPTLAIALLAPSLLAPSLLAPSLGAQVGGPPSPESEEQIEEGTDSEANDAIPPIPDWSPLDLTVREQFTEGRKQLDERRYDEAKKSFRRLRSKAKGNDGEPVVARCLLEAEGGLLCEKAGKYAEKGKLRRIISLWLKEGEDLKGTFTGAELEKFYEEAIDELFETLADFEKKKAEASPDSDDEEEGEGGGGRAGQEPARGSTRYGANSREVTGDLEGGEVRQGNGSLYWMTTSGIGVLQFEISDEVRLSDYRYLRLSIRTEDRKIEPTLLLLFDCESGDFSRGVPGGGRGGRRGGGWGAAAVNRRVGFHQNVTPQQRWQDLRLDLEKFTERGNPKWGNVLFLRVVSLGGAETGIFLDDVILEKE
jgi:hypothetical protein